MKFLLLFAALLVGSCLGNLPFLGEPIFRDNPNQCCAPDQWEGSVITSLCFHHLSAYKTEISHDSRGGRVRMDICKLGGRSDDDFDDVEHHHPLPDKFSIIYLQKSKRLFVFGDSPKRCFMKELDREINRICAGGKESEFEGKHKLGGDLDVQLFTKKWSTVRMYQLFSSNKCIPVSYTITNSKEKTSSFMYSHKEGMAELSFWDLTSGIKDEKVFDLPDACKTAALLDDTDPAMVLVEETINLLDMIQGD
jgi:hypothetical protein